MKLINYDQDKNKELDHYGELTCAINNGDNIFSDIVEFMENPISRKVYTQYLSKPYEQESMLWYLWMYSKIEKESEKHAMNLSPTQKIAFLRQALLNPQMRSNSLEQFLQIQKKLEQK